MTPHRRKTHRLRQGKLVRGNRCKGVCEVRRMGTFQYPMFSLQVGRGFQLRLAMILGGPS